MLLRTSQISALKKKKCFQLWRQDWGKNVLGAALVLIHKLLAPSRYDFLHLPLSIGQQN